MRKILSREERRKLNEERKRERKKRKEEKRIKQGILRGPRRERRKEALRNGKERARRALPSGFTLTNAFMGFFALLAVTSGEILRAVALLLFASLMDMLDGKIARQMNLTSEFGLQLDSLADTISFVVVPASMIYFVFFNSTLGAVLGAVAVLCGILRLARFNLQETKEHYIGISTPLFTAMVITLSLAKTLSPESGWATLPQPAYAAIFLILALTMISPFNYPAFRGAGFSRYKMRLFFGILLFGFAAFYSQLSACLLILFGYVLIFAFFLIPLLFEPIARKARVVSFSAIFLISAALIYHFTNDTTTLLIFPVFYVILGLPSLSPCFATDLVK